MIKTLAWIGDGASRMEVARVEQIEPTFAASGTQLGVTYELRYRLEPETLHLELVGERTLESDSTALTTSISDGHRCSTRCR